MALSDAIWTFILLLFIFFFSLLLISLSSLHSSLCVGLQFKRPLRICRPEVFLLVDASLIQQREQSELIDKNSPFAVKNFAMKEMNSDQFIHYQVSNYA